MAKRAASMLLLLALTVSLLCAAGAQEQAQQPAAQAQAQQPAAQAQDPCAALKAQVETLKAEAAKAQNELKAVQQKLANTEAQLKDAEAKRKAAEAKVSEAHAATKAASDSDAACKVAVNELSTQVNHQQGKLAELAELEQSTLVTVSRKLDKTLSQSINWAKAQLQSLQASAVPGEGRLAEQAL